MNSLAAHDNRIAGLHNRRDGLFGRSQIRIVFPEMGPGDDSGGAVFFGEIGQGDEEIDRCFGGLMA